MSLDFLEGLGELMRREGLEEIQLRDGDRVLRVRRSRGGFEAPEKDEGLDLLRAPLSGILLLRSMEDERPAVSPGQRKLRGETLFFIEAMKHLNEVRAPHDLVVLELLAEDRAPVEAGVPVLRVRWEEEET